MRHIAFRAKVILDIPVLGLPEEITEGKWVYGDLHFRCKYPHIHLAQPRGCKAPIDIETLGQDTGLRDKNGRVVWEGDIVRYRSSDERYTKNPRFKILPIRYDESSARFMAGNIYWQNLNSSKIEVIGNIHDNPELLSE